MPTLRQGDIFSASLTGKFGLSVVFGHLGHNFMSSAWGDFLSRVPNLVVPVDPFSAPQPEPLMFQPGCSILFVPDTVAPNQRRGMTDEQLTNVLGDALRWAKAHDVKETITNGISNIDRALSPHGATAINRASDNRRTNFLVQFLTRQEKELKVKITLMSLDDAFVRERL